MKKFKSSSAFQATVVFETAEKEEEEVKPQKPVANQKRSVTKLHSASPQVCHHLFGLATARLDLIRILNPQPPNLKTLLREMIINQWDKGIQEEGLRFSFTVKVVLFATGETGHLYFY